MIYYQDGVKKMRPVLSREQYLSLRGSEQQKAILKAVRERPRVGDQGSGMGNDQQKQRLVQMNYSCLPNEDGSLKGSTKMSTTVGMDIDHITAEEMQPLRERILAKKDELGLLMLELSARAQGYHLVFRRRPELSQEENLKWASELLKVEFDSRFFAKRSIPAMVVLCERPIATISLERTRTSPPSMEKSSERSYHCLFSSVAKSLLYLYMYLRSRDSLLLSWVCMW